MKHRYATSIILLLFFHLWFPTSVVAQHKVWNEVKTTPLTATIDGEMLNLNFDLVLDKVRFSSERQAIFTPQIVAADGKQQELPRIVVNGKLRGKLYNRVQWLNNRDDDSSVYQVVQAKGKWLKGTLPYKLALPYESWMQDASLYLLVDLCGCGGEKQEVYRLQVSNRIAEKTTVADTIVVKEIVKEEIVEEVVKEVKEPEIVKAFTPKITFTRPAKEAVKKRAETGTAYVVFRSGASVIIPEQGNNRAELDKIRKSIEHIQGESETEITSITIQAYASPEGNSQSNYRLSENRAAALSEYIRRNYHLPHHLIRSSGMGEDWEGLTNLVEKDFYLDRKNEVLQIIRTTGDPDARKQRLKSLGGGRTYRYLLDQLYPLLRRSDYRVEYTVPSFSPGKSRELLRSHPEMLSLEEMYEIALTHGEGSPEFNRIIEQAVQLFPADKAANLNAAAVYLLNKQVEQAEQILIRYQNDPQAWNNLGVVRMLQQRWEESEFYLSRALRNSSGDALANLLILKDIRKQ